MNRYFLETSAIVGYLRGKREFIDRIDNLSGELTSSFVCLAELYEGIFRVKLRDETERAVLDFFSGLSEIYGLDEDIAKNFGQIRKELKEIGRVIEDIDIFLAATCISYKLIMVTSNLKHFRRVPDLKIIEV